MTISLAIDTSTSRTSVAVIESDAIIWHGFRDGATSHGDALPALVSEALLNCLTIDRVVVGMGPGPYTGLRVGIAFARTFAFGRGLEVRGVCSLDAIASTVREEMDFMVATDARRKEVYWAKYISGSRVDGPNVGFPTAVSEMGLPVFGEGAVKYGIYSSDEILFPDMVALVSLSENTNVLFDEPIYLRRPDALPTSERVM